MIEQNNTKSYYIENTKFSRIALAQVYEILMEYEDGIESIPKNVMKFLEDNRDKEYIFKDFDDLENAVLEQDAEKLLIYIYTKYLATPEERDVLEQLDKAQYEEKQKALKDTYSTNDLFTNQSEPVNKEIQDLHPIFQPKENIFKRLFKFILNLFGKKKE